MAFGITDFTPTSLQAAKLDGALAFSMKLTDHKDLIIQSASSGVQGLLSSFSDMTEYNTAIASYSDAISILREAKVKSATDPFAEASGTKKQTHVDAALASFYSAAAIVDAAITAAKTAATNAYNATAAGSAERTVATTVLNAVNDLEAASAALKTGDFSKIDAAVTKANEALTAANTAVTTATTNVTNATTAVTNATTAVTNATTAVTNANTAVTTANGKVSTATAERDAAQAKVNSLTGITPPKPTELAAAQVELTVAKDKLTAAQTEQTTANGNLTTAQGNLATAEANLVTAKANLVTANQKLDQVKAVQAAAVKNLAAANDLKTLSLSPVTQLLGKTPTVHELGSGYSLSTWGDSGLWTLVGPDGKGIIVQPDGNVDSLDGAGKGWDFSSVSTFVLPGGTKITVDPAQLPDKTSASLQITRANQIFSITDLKKGSTPPDPVYDLGGRQADKDANDGHVFTLNGDASVDLSGSTSGLNTSVWKEGSNTLGDSANQREAVAQTATIHEEILDFTDIEIPKDLHDFLVQVGYTLPNYDGDVGTNGRPMLNEIELLEVGQFIDNVVRDAQEAFNQTLLRITQANSALHELNVFMENVSRQGGRKKDGKDEMSAEEKSVLQSIEKRLIAALNALKTSGNEAVASNIASSAESLLGQLTQMTQQGGASAQTSPTPVTGSPSSTPSDSSSPPDAVGQALRRAGRLLSGLGGFDFSKIPSLPEAPPQTSPTPSVSSENVPEGISDLAQALQELSNIMTVLGLPSEAPMSTPALQTDVAAGIQSLLTALSGLGVLNTGDEGESLLKGLAALISSGAPTSAQSLEGLATLLAGQSTLSPEAQRELLQGIAALISTEGALPTALQENFVPELLELLSAIATLPPEAQQGLLEGLGIVLSSEGGLAVSDQSALFEGLATLLPALSELPLELQGKVTDAFAALLSSDAPLSPEVVQSVLQDIASTISADPNVTPEVASNVVAGLSAFVSAASTLPLEARQNLQQGLAALISPEVPIAPQDREALVRGLASFFSSLPEVAASQPKVIRDVAAQFASAGSLPATPQKGMLDALVAIFSAKVQSFSNPSDDKPTVLLSSAFPAEPTKPAASGDDKPTVLLSSAFPAEPTKPAAPANVIPMSQAELRELAPALFAFTQALAAVGASQRAASSTSSSPTAPLPEGGSAPLPKANLDDLLKALAILGNPGSSAQQGAAPSSDDLYRGLETFIRAASGMGVLTPASQTSSSSTSQATFQSQQVENDTKAALATIMGNFQTDSKLLEQLEANLRKALIVQTDQYKRADNLFTQSQEIVQQFVQLIKEDDMVKEVVNSDDLSDEDKEKFSDKMLELRKDWGVEWGSDDNRGPSTPAEESRRVSRMMQSGMMV